jgi:hypothetical protein
VNEEKREEHIAAIRAAYSDMGFRWCLQQLQAEPTRVLEQHKIDAKRVGQFAKAFEKMISLWDML